MPCNLVYSFPPSGSGGDDHHSGYYYIEAGLEVTIELYKQSITYGVLDIVGSLLIDGQLITEP